MSLNDARFRADKISLFNLCLEGELFMKCQTRFWRVYGGQER